MVEGSYLQGDAATCPRMARLLIYFAANYRKPYYSWSAISRPPYLTGLALWPKGDGWGGGGHFLRRGKIALNHRDNEMELATGYSVPRWLKVTQFGQRPGWGEDDPIWPERLKRDGWELGSYPSDDETKEDRGGKILVGVYPSPHLPKIPPEVAEAVFVGDGHYGNA